MGVIERSEETLTGESKLKRQKIIRLTPEWQKRLSERHAELEAEKPVNLPMIHPPQDWTTPKKGGYLTPRLRTDLIRGVGAHRHGESFVDELFSTDMDEVYAALNRVQATRWQINKPVLDIMYGCVQRGETLGDLPPADELPVPECPISVDRDLKQADMPAKMQATFKKWKADARAVHEANTKNRSLRVALQTKLKVARECSQHEAIYFPHSLDFRGRLYPLTAELSPQSDDTAKGLLQFADGKPVGRGTREGTHGLGHEPARWAALLDTGG
jgi:DNA-directed RNA polymerase